MVNPYTLRMLWLNNFVQELDYFSKILNQKLLPALDIDKDVSNEIEKSESKLSNIFNPESDDPVLFCEKAYEVGVDFSILANGIVQGITNMFTAGLYHFFEQQLLKFHRNELLFPNEENTTELISLREAINRLKNDYRINIAEFRTWGKIEQLKLVSNSIKHGDGWSCARLKEIRPDFFVHPIVKKSEMEIDLSSYKPVFQPLAGDGFYISLDTFNEFVETIKLFWDEFEKAFEIGSIKS